MVTSAEHCRDTHEVHRPHWAHPVDLGGSQEPRFGGHPFWSVASDSGQGGRPLWVECARGPGLAPRPVLRLPSLVTVPPKAHGQPGCEGPSRSARAPFPGEQGVYLRRGSAGGRRSPGEVSGVSLKLSVVQGPRRLLRVLFSGGVSGARWGCLPALMEPLVGGAPSRQAARQVWPKWAGVNFAREDGHLQNPQSPHRCWAVFARQDELLPVSRGS